MCTLDFIPFFKGYGSLPATCGCCCLWVQPEEGCPYHNKIERENGKEVIQIQNVVYLLLNLWTYFVKNTSTKEELFTKDIFYILRYLLIYLGMFIYGQFQNLILLFLMIEKKLGWCIILGRKETNFFLSACAPWFQYSETSFHLILIKKRSITYAQCTCCIQR